MEPRVNYAIAGFFVLLFGTLGAIIIVWLVSSGGIKKNYKRYVILTTQNVAGLHIDSSVKYKGLDVGHVYDIKINKTNPNYVEIYIEVDKNLPVDKHTVAQILSNGLTGLSYLNLGYSNNPPKLPSSIKNFRYPVIPVVPSGMDRILSKLPDMISSIERAANHLSQLFDNNTNTTIKRTMTNIEVLTKNLDKTRRKLDRVLENSQELLTSLDNNSKAFSKTLNLTNNLILDLDNLTNTTQNTTIKESYTTLKELEETLRQLKQTIIEIKQNPSIILHGRKNFNLPVKK